MKANNDTMSFKIVANDTTNECAIKCSSINSNKKSNFFFRRFYNCLYR